MGGDKREKRRVRAVRDGRSSFFEKIEIERFEKDVEGEAVDQKKIKRIDRGRQRKGRWKRISSLRYNVCYRQIKGEGILGYLKKGWSERRWSRLARFRLGNGMRARWYWKEEEKSVECVKTSWKHGSTYGKSGGGGDQRKVVRTR